MKARKRISKILTVILLLLVSVIILIPFWFLLISSFKPAADIFGNGLNIKLDFSKMSFENYMKLFHVQDGIFWIWFKNSVVITVIQTVLVLVFCSMVGYGLAQYNFKGRNLIFTLVLVMLMVPGDILLIPMYKLVTNLGLMDSFAGVILPGVVPAATVFFFRQYAIGLPRDYGEAARIDGAGEFRIFAQVYAPMMLPAYGAMTIMTAMGAWNNFLWPLIVMRSDENLVIPAGLLTAMTPYGNNYDIVFSGSMMSIIPIIILFLLNQKSFINGMTIGGIKG
ncbi:carbohydrate ABC transporter permease [Heyndrickxia coagulans]|uniref:carbohydrate ABC transporter permease n=1 Tax=Heyndrickxia coagulans TaxID=1398 RepID=UPI0008F8095B|nr:carbohydrate ABC transporter permease [Heyndrickxia coagulans]APB36849.1 arabinose transporter permease [Heyndrickxia coagulans]QPG52651.1 carbohydrate ABC transporter permease [Heyndrickxia coagulans]WNE60672.1 carbohydrate ABC transporter permease [Heyndrickxia coagulans]